jgi:hypothetical protein
VEKGNILIGPIVGACTMVGSATFVTFKFNDGESAIICGKCRKIIKEGKDFTDEETYGMKNGNLLPAQFCGECRD